MEGDAMTTMMEARDEEIKVLREALERIAELVYVDAEPPELRAQNENVLRIALEALKEAQ
jgi:trans-2-enoyl-CoA reductase